MKKSIWVGLGALVVVVGRAGMPMPAAAQAPGAQPADSASDPLPSYKPPLRGAPGGRIGGASRGSEAASMPMIEPLAPDGVAGQTADPSPTLYYFISRPPSQPLRLTIRSPNVAQLVADATIPAPRAAGIQAIRLSDYRVQLQPGATYVWSVSLVMNPNMPSQNLVASATIVRTAPDPSVDAAARAAPPRKRAALLAQAGFWYDAVAAAVEAGNTDRHAALDALLEQVGLRDAAAADRAAAGGSAGR
jgi:Domain of Unknown Function (DUF928)